ncbi:MAG: hypothetical protein Kow0068_18650 [Marinilabiliales bacterium]
MSFSQRNANQINFKKQAKEEYINQDYEIYQDVDYLFNNEQQQDVYNTNSGKPYFFLNDNELVFQVKTLMNVKAEKFLAVFNLTQIGKTAQQADSLINLKINSFIKDARKLGINDEDIYIDMIYLIPTFEFTVEKKLFSKTYTEVPTGFEMQKNIHITFTDINIVDKLVTYAAKSEIYDLVKLDFFIDDYEAINDTIFNVSIDYINRKIAAFEKLNFSLKDKYHIFRDAFHTIYPETQYSDYDAFVEQSIEAIQKKTGVTTIRKPKTVAYEQEPYDEFNVILNPFIKEPVVQFIYTLQVKYILDKPEKEQNKNIYYFVTPNGEVKPLQINQ